jgi:hypothetical protein
VLDGSKLSLAVSILCLSFAGCGDGYRFEPVAGTQEVVFMTVPTVGGGADPVYASQDTHPKRALRYKGLPVCVFSDEQQMIQGRLGPQPPENRDLRRVVHAKVHLVPANATQSTNPPSKRSVYKVVIEELIDAQWYVP